METLAHKAGVGIDQQQISADYHLKISLVKESCIKYNNSNNKYYTDLH